VPKFAATLASLLLIASSIGVNIARYPQVGQTMGADERARAAETADFSPAAQQTNLVETANQDTRQAGETGAEPAKPQAAATVAQNEQPRVAEPIEKKPADSPAPSQPGPVVPILDVRPMVPVASLTGATASQDPRACADEVRRLPPVDSRVSPITDLQAAETDGSEAYAATSTP
jgi:hypothetical protein